MTHASVSDIFKFYRQMSNLCELSQVYHQIFPELHPTVGGAHNKVAGGERFDILNRVFKKVFAAVNYKAQNWWIVDSTEFREDDTILFASEKTQA